MFDFMSLTWKSSQKYTSLVGIARPLTQRLCVRPPHPSAITDRGRGAEQETGYQNQPCGCLHEVSVRKEMDVNEGGSERGGAPANGRRWRPVRRNRPCYLACRQAGPTRCGAECHIVSRGNGNTSPWAQRQEAPSLVRIADNICDPFGTLIVVRSNVGSLD